VKVAAAQFACGLDTSANLARVLETVADVARTGAELVVFPEGTMCGFGQPDTDLAPYAQPLDGPFVTALCDMARRHDVQIVAGMFEPSGAVGRVFNTIVAVGPFGLLGAYHKYHLYDALGWRESDRIVAGDPHLDDAVVFDVADLTVGIMNCYDLRFPEMARHLVDLGATVLLEPANWVAGEGKAETFTTLLRARAIESTAYVVAAAKPAPECAGCSAIIDPRGTVLTALGEADDGVLFADLSADRIDEVRATLPVLEHRRFAVIPR
jgi:predicted amidohydrolase